MTPKDKGLYIGCGFVFVVIFAIGYGIYWWNWGPTSRHSLNPMGKTINLDLPADFKTMINASSGGNEAEMLLTYETTSGEIKTHEYNKGGMFETTIVWRKPGTK